uniref:Glucosylceramidase n=1 Tax=Tetranychus urticae TaxID=32264 RepID=T1K6T6_TETUR
MSTEACEGSIHFAPDAGVMLGNWTRAETYARDIIEGLNRWSTGWVDWNIVLSMDGGPNWASNYVDAPIIVSDDGTEYYKQPMFYSLAHFSKFLKPGSQRIYHQIDEAQFGLLIRNILNQNPAVKHIANEGRCLSGTVRFGKFYDKSIEMCEKTCLGKF